MGRRSAEATKARLMWPSLRAPCGDFFFAAAEPFCDLVEWVFFAAVWPEDPAWNDSAITNNRSRKRLTNTAQLPRKTGPHKRNIVIGQNPDQFLIKIIGGRDRRFSVALF